MFRAYVFAMDYGLSAEKIDDVGVFGMGRVRVERVDESGGRLFDGLLCDCLVQPGSEVDMVYSMLDRAFGDGFDMVHHFEKIGLGKIRSLSELTVKLAAMVPAR